MVSVNQQRTSVNRNSANLEPQIFKQSIEEAVSDLVLLELGFGGNIRYSECSEVKLVVTTRINSWLDTTTYTGTEDEINFLHLAGLIYEQSRVRKDVNETYQFYTDSGFPLKALYASKLIPIISGGAISSKNILLAIVCFSFGLTLEQARFCISYTHKVCTSGKKLWVEALQGLRARMSFEDISGVIGVAC